MRVPRTTRNVHVQRRRIGEPLRVDVRDLDVVGDKRWRRVIALIVIGVNEHRIRVCALPGDFFTHHCRIVVDEKRILLRDIPPIRARGSKGCVLVILHVIRNEHFVEMSVCPREQNGCAAHAHAIGAACNPVRGIARRE